MMFVMYGFLESNSNRLDIGDDKDDRSKSAKTALYTAIVYIGFIFLSIGCIYKGKREEQLAAANGRNKDYDEQIPDGDEDDMGREPIYEDRPTYNSTHGKQSKVISSTVQGAGI